jgi:hypothetical protein
MHRLRILSTTACVAVLLPAFAYASSVDDCTVTGRRPANFPRPRRQRKPKATETNMTPYSDLKLHIDGEWLGAGQRRVHRVVNPATGATLGELPLVDTADLDRALQAADRGFRQSKRSTSDERARVLKGAAQLIRQRVDHIARVATMEEGKTLAETRIEAMATANLFEFYAEECRRTYGRVLVRPTGTRSLVVKEPVGPVAAFSPWNFPIHKSGPQARRARRGRLLRHSQARRRSARVGYRSGACAGRCGATRRCRSARLWCAG